LASPGGAGRNKTLGQDSFLQSQVCVPPLEIQTKIAEVLATWDRAILILERLIINGQKRRSALSRKLLAGEIRVSGFQAPWQQTTLGQLGHFRKGKGVARNQVITTGLPCVRYGEIYTHHNDFIRQFYSFISPSVALESERILKGDLLFAISGETAEDIGKCVAFLGDEEAYAGGDIVLFTPNKADPKFLAYLLNSEPIVAQKSRLAQGKSIVHISASNLSGVSFALPELGEQLAVAKILSKLDDGVTNLQKQVELLRQEKSALMQQLLLGKRRVKTQELAA
jgi:type I restriction enzyme S subunit